MGYLKRLEHCTVTTRLDNIGCNRHLESVTEKAWSGNTFLECGVLYAMKSYDKFISEIHKAVDTNPFQA